MHASGLQACPSYGEVLRGVFARPFVFLQSNSSLPPKSVQERSARAAMKLPPPIDTFARLSAARPSAPPGRTLRVGLLGDADRATVSDVQSRRLGVDSNQRASSDETS